MKLSHETEPNMELINIISWYSLATLQDIELARKNNSGKLDELLVKYANEVRLISIIKQGTGPGFVRAGLKPAPTVCFLTQGGNTCNS